MARLTVLERCHVSPKVPAQQEKGPSYVTGPAQQRGSPHSSDIRALNFGVALVKECVQENNFLISQLKHMLWVLERTVSVRQFF